MTDLENEVMRMFTDGELPELAILREQWRRARAYGRHFTGVGFWLDFEVPADCPRLGTLSTVLDVPGVEHGTFFDLFITDGVIHSLEQCTWGDGHIWPDSPCRPRYNLHVGKPGAWAIKDSHGERQWDYVKLMLTGD